MWRVLLVDAGGAIGDLIESLFDSAEVSLIQTSSYQEGLDLIRASAPDIALISAGDHGADALDTLQRVRAVAPKLPTIFVLSGEPRQRFLVEAMGLAFDCVLLPVDRDDLKQRIHVALKAAHDIQSEGAYGATVRAESGQEAMVGKSARMQAVFATIERLAHSEAFTLISGESGTGKDLTARCIHHDSKRRDHFLISVDCLERQETLERELFGQPRRHRVSRLEQAAGGTLFLDHVERMPLSIQTKLLELLEGSAHESAHQMRELDVRLVAATTGTLEEAVADRAFREDLFALLSTGRIDLPPLRNRLEDIPLIGSSFLGRFAAATSQKPKSLSLIVARVLAHYRWPGNVRELESVLRRANSFATTELIQLGDLPADFLSAVGPALLDASAPKTHPADENRGLTDWGTLSQTLFKWARQDAQFRLIPAMERELIIHAMAETGGCQVQAARLLGITRATLRKRLHRFNIQCKVFIQSGG